MSTQKFSLVDDFIDRFKHSLTHKSKTSTSDRNHLEEIVKYLETQWISLGIEISPYRVSLSRNPVVYLKSKNFISVDLMLLQLENILKGQKIKYKRHKYSGCYPIFYLYNPSIPSLLSSKSHTLVTLTSHGNSRKPCFKLELLQDHQVVKILDAQISNLRAVIWTGNKMAKMNFEFSPDPKCVSLEPQDLVQNIELMARTKEGNWKMEADFTFYTGRGLMLQKIRDIKRV
jgi:hypothetical protein